MAMELHTCKIHDGLVHTMDRMWFTEVFNTGMFIFLKNGIQYIFPNVHLYWCMGTVVVIRPCGYVCTSYIRHTCNVYMFAQTISTQHVLCLP